MRMVQKIWANAGWSVSGGVTQAAEERRAVKVEQNEVLPLCSYLFQAVLYRDG